MSLRAVSASTNDHFFRANVFPPGNAPKLPEGATPPIRQPVPGVPKPDGNEVEQPQAVDNGDASLGPENLGQSVMCLSSDSESEDSGAAVSNRAKGKR